MNILVLSDINMTFIKMFEGKYGIDKVDAVPHKRLMVENVEDYDLVYIHLFEPDLKYYWYIDKMIEAHPDILFIKTLHYNNHLYKDTINFRYLTYNNIYNGDKIYDNLVYYNFNSHVERYGQCNLINENSYNLGNYPYNYKAQLLIKKDILNIINGIKGRVRKVLVTDLDDTFWKGTVTEEGVKHLRSFTKIQKMMKELKNWGILLCICSKNDYNTIEQHFKANEYPVDWDDFIIKKINHEYKAKNILEISEELNIGIEDIVFLDDNPRNREIVRATGACVPEFYDKDEFQIHWFEDIIHDFFPKLNINEYDKIKTESYKTRIERKKIVKDYIENLDISITVDKVNVIPARLYELSTKTNQFNFNKGDIDKGLNYLSIKYVDRCGDEGIVGYVEFISTIDATGVNINNFVVSCRVLGNRVEELILSKVLDFFNDSCYDIIKFKFTETDKNKLAEEFCNKYKLQDANNVKEILNDIKITGNI